MLCQARYAVLLCLTLGLASAAPQTQAQSQAQSRTPLQSQVEALSGADLYNLQYLAQADPDAAARRIEETLAALQSQPGADPQVLFDLWQLRAEIARAGGSPEAAGIYMELAGLALRSPELGEDPVVLYAEAQALYETQGNLEDAQIAADEKLAVMLDRAYDGEAIARAYDAFARLSLALGDTALAQRASDLAEEARRPPPPPVAALVESLPSGPAPETVPGTRGEATGFTSIDVYYATDRALTGDSDPARVYGGGRGELDLGVAIVTVPMQHTPGMVESASIWRLEFRENPSRHVILQSVTRLEDAAFYDRLSSEFDADTSEAFVFVHGYNVTFDQAAKRAAQMAYDMHYPAVPILYSWPSRGSTLAYVADSAVVRLSGRRLAEFLDTLAERSGAGTIHIVAHSMGNRALTDALEILALRRGVQEGDAPVFGQVLFAAPDVDAGLFARMVQTIRPIAQRLTLYASEQDWALVSSRKLHGNAPRAGQGGEVTLVDANLDSIDMSELGEDMLAHSYFADQSSALADIVALFWRDAPPEKRCGLEPRQTGAADAPVTWRYQAGACETDELIGALSHLRAAGVSDPGRIPGILASIVTDPGLAERLQPPLLRLLQP
ncbi:alpha/beta hydrolase [Marinibacterium profundimaris]|uniref:alpha/beta hydrolase n=1 Tax=Marinibacterium profundimaris TaxID=1679460 RepID=UPI000B5240DB|nr:alpha/beta hydrolase [Marinibacterium profundimaris]